MKFNELKKNLKKDFSGYKQIKLALLGDSATQFLAQAIRGEGFNNQLDIQIFEADFNQIDTQILDLSSELHSFKPCFTVIFESGHKLLQKFNKLSENERKSFANTQIERLISLSNVLLDVLKTKVICFNYGEEDDRIYGNFANKVQSSFIFQQRKLNYLLAEFSAHKAGFYICDISTIQNTIGRNNLFSPSIYINSEMVLSIDSIPIVAKLVVQITAAIQGQLKKCVILDLDNTLWGGVIGDDGINNIQIGALGIGKAFTEFQYWVKKLQQRGIIICICSKNTESIAKEPFEKHPEMILSLKDIAIFIANWNPKADNIRHIKQILNIGYDSMVFIDDNPFERNIVRENIPGIMIPELPKDPAEYLEFLYSLNLFETASYSSEDTLRTEQYQKESERNAVQASFVNESDFLKSLHMFSKVQPFNSFSIPRIAQLSQRSNQFNLRTIRYNEVDIKIITSSQTHFTFSFTLEDKFGDSGLICAVILEERSSKDLFIDTWFMSCRVLKRSMEYFVINYIVNFALNNGYHVLIGEYIPTEKNVLVKDLYSNLGFIKKGNYWWLSTITYQQKECFITIRDN